MANILIHIDITKLQMNLKGMLGDPGTYCV